MSQDMKVVAILKDSKTVVSEGDYSQCTKTLLKYYRKHGGSVNVFRVIGEGETFLHVHFDMLNEYMTASVWAVRNDEPTVIATMAKGEISIGYTLTTDEMLVIAAIHEAFADYMKKLA